MTASTRQPGPGRGRTGHRPGAVLQTTTPRPRVRAASQSPWPWVRGAPGRQPPRGARRWFRAGPGPAETAVVIIVTSRARRRSVAVVIACSSGTQGSRGPRGGRGRRVRAGTLGTRIPGGPASPALSRWRLLPPAAPELPGSRRGVGARGGRPRGGAPLVVRGGSHRTRGRVRGRRRGGGPGGRGTQRGPGPPPGGCFQRYRRRGADPGAAGAGGQRGAGSRAAIHSRASPSVSRPSRASGGGRPQCPEGPAGAGGVSSAPSGSEMSSSHSGDDARLEESGAGEHWLDDDAPSTEAGGGASTQGGAT